MKKSTYTALLIIMLALIIAGALCAVFADSIGGWQFGQEKSVTIKFYTLTDEEYQQLNSEIENTFKQAGLVPVDVQHLINLLDGHEGAVYYFDSMTNEQAAKVQKLEEKRLISDVAIGVNGKVNGFTSLLWGGVALAIVIALYTVIIALSGSNLGRTALVLSMLTVVLGTLLSAVAVSMILAIIGIKFTTGSIAAIIAATVFTIIINVLFVNRLADAKDRSIERVFSTLKKPVLTGTIIMLIAAILLSAAMTSFMLSATVPFFVGILVGMLANFYVFLPMWAELSKK